MFQDKKVGLIEDYRKELTEVSEVFNPRVSRYWARLSDCTDRYSADQLNFVTGSQEVAEVRAEMFDTFLLYLFDKYKDSFASLECFRPLCDRYIDTVLKVGAQYSAHQAQVADENKALREKVAELERRLNVPDTK